MGRHRNLRPRPARVTRTVGTMRARRRHAAACGAVLAVAVTTAVAVSRDDAYSNGPFGHADSSYGSSYGVAQGAVFTDGMHVLQNLGDRPVRLIGVRFEDGEPGLELIGAEVAGLERAIGSYQRLPSYPPVQDPPDVDLGPLVALEGFVIPPGGEYATKGVELLLGIRKTVAGRATRRALLITYEVDGDRAVARTVGSCDDGTPLEPRR